MMKDGHSRRPAARAQDKALRIADLEGEDKIAAHHVGEAVQYHRLDRQLQMDTNEWYGVPGYLDPMGNTE